MDPQIPGLQGATEGYLRVVAAAGGVAAPDCGHPGYAMLNRWGCTPSAPLGGLHPCPERDRDAATGCVRQGDLGNDRVLRDILRKRQVGDDRQRGGRRTRKD